MGYKIVQVGSIPSLEFAVTALMSEGWRPLGGPFKTGVDWSGDFCQAMVKGGLPVAQRPQSTYAPPAKRGSR